MRNSRARLGVRWLLLAGLLFGLSLGLDLPFTPAIKANQAITGTGPGLAATFTTTPPTVDGVIAPGEWGSPLNITLNGFNDPTKTRSGELYILNTATDLFVGLVVSEPAESLRDFAEINLDPDHDHTATAGREDTLRFERGPVDLFWGGSGWSRDSVQHGAAARTFAGGKYTYEFSKPLNSGDSQDMAASPGATLGFRFHIGDADVDEGFRYPADTRSGSGDPAVEWAKWADLRLAAPPITTAPTQTSPPNGVQLAGMGATLSWTNPSGTTQYQIRVVPFSGDGPDMNLIRNVESSYTVKAPSFGGPDANYVMLPDITYTWRVRATSKPTSISENDPEWGPWSPDRTFRTGTRDSSRIGLVSPGHGATVGAGPQVLRWDNGDKDVFYHEVQASPDPAFGAGGPVASVWHNLVHGDVGGPLNSWSTPALQSNTTYYWRVRPRVQGDGSPVAWSQTWSFIAQ